MASIGTIWGDQPQVQMTSTSPVESIAQIELEVPASEYGVTNKSPEFREKFP
ncbi:hypothetical protein F5I97DRAFT_1792866, partial [Phlebopus sp. FC_14]